MTHPDLKTPQETGDMTPRTEESDRWTIGGQRAMTQLVNPNSTYQGG